jgi:hypothetical protein
MPPCGASLMPKQGSTSFTIKAPELHRACGR